VLSDACVEAGGDPEECAERARRFHGECVERCDHGPRAPCVDRCAHLGRRVLAECIDEDGSLEDCSERARAALAECVAHCPRHVAPCAKRCVHEARVRYARCLERLEPEVEACIEAGGDPERCKNQAIRRCRGVINEFLVGCLGRCNDRPEPPEPPTCAERCESAGDRVGEACRAQGGSEEECAMAVEEFLARCRERCESPEPPDPCDFDCAGAAERLKARCLAAGVAEEECTQKAEELLMHCTDRLAEHCKGERIALGVATGGPYRDFLRGDSNSDGRRDVSDPVHVLDFLFRGGPEPTCMDAADANDDGLVNIADPITFLRVFFLGEGSLPEPFQEPGQDLTLDDLACD
ncbi:MAG TPA: hypothetical protein VMT52_07085, partial [Planctomycetota bacterium]|nr:hypothetical protein [Planctomycetota bacterium]